MNLYLYLCMLLLSIRNLKGLVGVSNFHRHNNEVGGQPVMKV